eukprot:9929498-Karenia_brevis.AAC.1
MREETDGERATLGLGLAAGRSFPSPFAHERQLAKRPWVYPLVAGCIWLKLLVMKYSEGEPAGEA